MDPLTSAAASGLRSRLQSLDMLANNLANASTSGFKVDREFYSTYMSPELAGASDPANGAQPVVEKPWTDFTQGTLQDTGNPLDVALSGSGFFSVNGPSGTLYTRNGNFQVSSSGLLTTGEGYPVRLVGGTTLQMQSTDPLEINADGEIRQSGQLLGQLDVTSFKDSAQLTKAQTTYYQASADAATTPTTAQVHQSKIESSNVVTAESAVRLVTLMRHFESLQKAIAIGSEMNKQAIDNVARINS